MSDTPRTDAAAFGTDDESLSRLFGIRELPRYVVPVDFARQLERELAAVTADLEFRRELGALQQQEYDKVTAERDALLRKSAERGVIYDYNKIKAEREASQQEARRLREALDKLHIVCETSKPEIYDWYLTDPFASDARQIALEALAPTSAPVHSDTEKGTIALSDLLQSCHSLFLKIADEDDKEQFQINQDLRRKLDALCLKIQQTI